MENTYKELVTTASLFAVYVQEVRKRLLKEAIETYIDTVVNRCKHNGGFHVVGLRTEFRIESGGSFSCGFIRVGISAAIVA